MGGQIIPFGNDHYTFLFLLPLTFSWLSSPLMLLPAYLSEVSFFLFILIIHILVQVLFSCLPYSSGTGNTICLEEDTMLDVPGACCISYVSNSYHKFIVDL